MLADYYTQAVMSPRIPTDLLTDAEYEFLLAFGFDAYEDSDGTTYFSAEDYRAGGYLESPDGEEEEEVDESDLEVLLQAIVKSSGGRLNHIAIEMAHTCSRMRPDGFGGAACFITADRVEWMSTYGWVEHQISELENQ